LLVIRQIYLYCNYMKRVKSELIAICPRFLTCKVADRVIVSVY